MSEAQACYLLVFRSVAVGTPHTVEVCKMAAH